MNNSSPLNDLGSFGGNYVSGKFGMAPNTLGTISSLAGGWFGGPIGSFAGQFLGNAAGQLFGMGPNKPDKPQMLYGYDFGTGDPYSIRNKVYGQDTLDQYGEYVNSIGDTAGAILGKLGVAPAYNQFQLGTLRGLAGYGVGTPEMGLAHNIFENTRPTDRYYGTIGKRTSGVDQQTIQQAGMGFLNDLLPTSISRAGLTNGDIFGRFGLPTDVAGFQAKAPNFQFGAPLDFSASANISGDDILRLYQMSQDPNWAATLNGDPQPQMPEVAAPSQGSEDDLYPMVLAALANAIRPSNFGGLRQGMQGRQVQQQGGQGAMGQAINKILQAQQQQMPGAQQGMPQMPGVGTPQQAGNSFAEFMRRMQGHQQGMQQMPGVQQGMPQSIPMQKPGFGGDIAGMMQRMQQMQGVQQGGQDNRRLQLLQMLMAMNQRAG
jgi:hypothetical protein